jgi:hypothetical protein
MKLTAALLALTMTVALGGCRRDSNPSATSAATSTTTTVAAENATLTPEQLGELGAQIRKDPANADALLAKNHLTRESFEQAIRDVTENVETARRYAEAYRKASA